MTPKAFNKAMGAVIRKERQAHGWTMEALGKRLDFTYQQQQKYEVGTNGYSAQLLVKVIDPEKPFFSETGFRSFIGVHAEPSPGIKPDEFARGVIAAHIRGECKGKLRPVKQEYRERYQQEKESPPGEMER